MSPTRTKRESLLHLDPATVRHARSLARKAGAPVVRLAKAHTTVSVERAVLRLAGLEGADRHLHCYVSERDWRESQVAIEALRELCGSLEVHLLTDGPLRLLATGAVRQAPWSLLQGEFAPRRR